MRMIPSSPVEVIDAESDTSVTFDADAIAI